jgi:hypothetical protein
MPRASEAMSPTKARERESRQAVIVGGIGSLPTRGDGED